MCERAAFGCACWKLNEGPEQKRLIEDACAYPRPGSVQTICSGL